MTRNRASAKKAGSAMESLVANFLAFRLADDRIERRTKNGNKDRGDITGIKSTSGDRVVIEVKDYRGELHASTWIREAHTEAANDDAAIGLVVAKRARTSVPGEQWVLMTLEDLAVLLGADSESRSV